MGISWYYNSLTPTLAALPAKIASAMHATMAKEAPDVQSFAQKNAPWQDQTGNAREGLKARPMSDPGSMVFEIHLFHTMPYGIYLETRWSGRYEVIVPTVMEEGRRVMETVDDVLGKLV